MQDHKEDVISTRKGCLGGSDARLIQGIAELGDVPKSAIKRMAICKGLLEPQQFTTSAIEMGNYIEEMVYNSLYSQDTRWQSNPCLVSEKYSRPNCKVIDHVDLYLQDDEKRVITIGECKATRLTYAQTYDEYKWQLFHHYLLGCEQAKKLGGYKVKVLLCHYLTDGIDLTQPFEFDPSRLTVKQLRGLERLSKSYRLDIAMDIIDAYLETMTDYYEEEISGDYLPEKVKLEFDTITTFLEEIKERESKVNDFKKRLTQFMLQKGIKSIKNDSWSITLVEASESIQFDAKAFISDMQEKHPRKAQKLLKTFEKRVNRTPYVTIKIK